MVRNYRAYYEVSHEKGTKVGELQVRAYSLSDANRLFLDILNELYGLERVMRLFCDEISIINTVLIVDEDEQVRRHLEETLFKQGHRVLSAACGREASSLVEAESVDLVITECRDRLISGTTFVNELRERAESGSKIPVIALTNSPEGAALSPFKFDKILAKPFLPHALSKAMQTVATLRGRVPVILSDVSKDEE